MSSRRPRLRFAAPLVVTLAIAPACIIHTGTSAPPRTTGTVDDHRAVEPTPTPIMNPPRPIDPEPPFTGSTEPPARPIANPPPIDLTGHGSTVTTPPIKQTAPVTDVVQAGPNQTTPPTQPAPSGLTTWTVTLRTRDQACVATIDVQCPPAPATCNPPPARKLASCPDGVTATSSLKIQELSPGACFVVQATPACPAGMACNPPRPAKIDCPR